MSLNHHQNGMYNITRKRPAPLFQSEWQTWNPVRVTHEEAEAHAAAEAAEEAERVAKVRRCKLN